VVGPTPSPQPTQIYKPIQVAGFVPMFDCCDSTQIDSYGGFVYYDYLKYDSTLCISIDGATYGCFTSSYYDLNADIQAKINVVVGPTFSSLVNNMSPPQRYIILTPIGTGNQYNGVTIAVTGTAGGYPLDYTIRTVPFQGGTNINCDCECREGKYRADEYPDDRDFPLQVYASTTCTDSYKNDESSFLFKYWGHYDAIGNGEFKLEEKINGSWTPIVTLNNNSYGTIFQSLKNNNIDIDITTSTASSVDACADLNLQGYIISWNKVFQTFGEGLYRFTIRSVKLAKQYCLNSTPFCLREWDCNIVDGSVKFESDYMGGKIGSVTKQGEEFQLCCLDQSVSTAPQLGTYSMIRISFRKDVLDNSLQISFSVPTGYVICPTYSFIPTTSRTTMMLDIANTINSYQATLYTPQFSANYDGTLENLNIICLDGQNIQVGIVYSHWYTHSGYPMYYAKDFSSNPLLSVTIIGTYPNITYTNVIRFTGGNPVTTTTSGNGSQVGIKWRDSIRFNGFFGYEQVEYERKFIKYATGIIDKIRDEAIKSFTLKTDNLPIWFHERFYAYGLMADHLYVSDYNLNNANYNYKHFFVVADSGYSPTYTNWSRYIKVKDVKFKEGQQFVYRNRCCGGQSGSGIVVPGQGRG
jgi:hypothetical protein